MRKLEVYIRKYGPVVGPKLYHALQSQAAHAGVSARLRRKIGEMTGRPLAKAGASDQDLPLFPGAPPDAAPMETLVSHPALA